MPASNAINISEIEWCINQIDSCNESLRGQISQYVVWTIGYIVLGLALIGISFVIKDSISQFMLTSGGGILSLIVPSYPFLKIGEQKRQIEKNDFLRESLIHPNISQTRKDKILNMLYEASKKGLEQ